VLSLVTRVTVFGRGASPGSSFAVMVVPHGGRAGQPASIRTHGGSGELRLSFFMRYRVVDVRRIQDGFAVQAIAYDIGILDRVGRELVAFHWEPDGIGTVRTPHAHLSAAAPIILPQRPGSPVAQTKTHLARLHLPTGPIAVEDVVELLIRDLAAVPRRPDWQHVLDEQRTPTVFES
jgi:hypothetical protein